MEEAAGTRWDFHYWKLLCDWSKLENNKTFISSASFQFIFIALSKPSMKQYESKVRCVRHHVQSWTIHHAPNKYQNLMLIAGIMFVLCTQCQWTIQLRGFNSTYIFCSLVQSRKFDCYTYYGKHLNANMILTDCVLTDKYFVWSEYGPSNLGCRQPAPGQISAIGAIPQQKPMEQSLY